MPDFVPVSGSIEFRITGFNQVSGKKVYNIGHVDCGSPLPTLAEVTAVAVSVATWVVGSYKSLYHEDIVVNEVRARSNAQEPGPVYVHNTINQIGALVGDIQPSSTTLCVNLLSGFTGLRRRGKFYVFPADETVMTDGLFTAGYCQGAEAVIELLHDTLELDGFALAVESRRDLALYQVEGYLAQPVPSHLKSRKSNQGI